MNLCKGDCFYVYLKKQTNSIFKLTLFYFIFFIRVLGCDCVNECICDGGYTLLINHVNMWNKEFGSFNPEEQPWNS